MFNKLSVFVFCLVIAVFVFSSQASRNLRCKENGREAINKCTDKPKLHYHPKEQKEHKSFALKEVERDFFNPSLVIVGGVCAVVVSYLLEHIQHFTRPKEQLPIMFISASPLIICVLSFVIIRMGEGGKMLPLAITAFLQIYVGLGLIAFQNLLFAYLTKAYAHLGDYLSMTGTHHKFLCINLQYFLPDMVIFHPKNVYRLYLMTWQYLFIRVIALCYSILLMHFISEKHHWWLDFVVDVPSFLSEMVAHYWTELFYSAVKNDLHFYNHRRQILFLLFLLVVTSWQELILKFLVTCHAFDPIYVPSIQGILLMIESVPFSFAIRFCFSMVPYRQVPYGHPQPPQQVYPRLEAPNGQEYEEEANAETEIVAFHNVHEVPDFHRPNRKRGAGEADVQPEESEEKIVKKRKSGYEVHPQISRPNRKRCAGETDLQVDESEKKSLKMPKFGYLVSQIEKGVHSEAKNDEVLFKTEITWMDMLRGEDVFEMQVNHDENAEVITDLEEVEEVNKQIDEMHVFVYGAIVRQLITDGAIVRQLVRVPEEVEEVNMQLDQMGYKIGNHLVDEILAKSNVTRCVDFGETAEVIAKVGFKMFLGVTAYVTNWDAQGTCCSLILENNPFVDFVELPDSCQGLRYCNILSGVVKGALEMVSMNTEITWIRDILRGDDVFELQVRFLKHEDEKEENAVLIMDLEEVDEDQQVARMYVDIYAAIVRQLITDLMEVEEVNTQFDQMCYSIGVHLADEFLAKSNVTRCIDFREAAEVIAKVGFKMLLGVTASVTNWDAEGTCCSLILDENPFSDFVELPETCHGLYYCSILSGVVSGALEMVSMKSEITWSKSMFRGDDTFELQVKLSKSDE